MRREADALVRPAPDAQHRRRTGRRELVRIGGRVDREYKIDVTSRDPWMKQSEDAMDLAMQVAKTKTYPWPNASNIIYPLMTTAAIEFAARAYPAIVSGRNVVKGKSSTATTNGVPAQDRPAWQPAMQQGRNGQPQPVWQVPPGARQERADRIAEHMSWQLLRRAAEWESDTDLLLHILPIVGCAFRKSYFDPMWARNMSLLVRPRTWWSTIAKSVELAPRCPSGSALSAADRGGDPRRDVPRPDLCASTERTGDDDAPRNFIEQHRWLDLDDDGYPEPYIVTMHEETSKVARIVARFDPEGVHFSKRDNKIVKIDPVQYYTKYDFLPNVEGGIYGMGFGQLLNPINAGVNTTLNMLIDAGHRQVVGGGFIGRGLNMHGGSVRFKLGEYKPINATGSAIRDAIVHLKRRALGCCSSCSAC
jgi:chaperonin GroES